MVKTSPLLSSEPESFLSRCKMREYIDYLILIPYFLGVLSYVIMSVYYSIKLDRYLKKNYREKWEYLTYVWPFGPGGSNPFRMIPFLYNKKEDFGDNKLRELKRNINKFWLAGLLSIAVGGPGIMLILYWFHKTID